MIKKLLISKNFSFNQLKKLEKFKNKDLSNNLSQRIFCICLGDNKKSVEIGNIIEEYIKNYLNYYQQLNSLKQCYIIIFPETKKNIIDEYTKIITELDDDNIKLSNIFFKDIGEEIKQYEKCWNSKFFIKFYKNMQINNKQKGGNL